MRTVFCLILCFGTVCFSVNGDYLVWKTGAVFRIVEDSAGLDTANQTIKVTLVDGSGKSALSYILKESIDWKATLDMNSGKAADNYVEPRVTVTDLAPVKKGQINTVAVIEENSYRLFGQVFIEGSVQNLLSVAVKNVALEVDFYDQYDRLAGTMKQAVNKQSLKSTESCGFKIMAPRPKLGQKISSYDIKVNWEE